MAGGREKMAGVPSGCRRWLLKDLLDNTLAPDEEAALVDHLDGCEACQRALDDLSASPAWWASVRESSARHADTTTFGALPGTSTRTGLAEDLSLDFLLPSDDPASLGRLGAYDIVQVVGRGGMGLVLKAFDPALNRFVAIKVIVPELVHSPSARKRFLREARAAAAVVHENVIKIYAVDEVRGLPYLVMPYVAGQSLRERIESEGPLEVRSIVQIGMQIAQGLAAAHAQGFVHRDVKPANILLDEGTDRVTLTDFGLARALDDVSLSQSGVVTGTPEYMSPEQARGDAVDHISDLFSLGVVLYAMGTGRSPFRAQSTLAALRKVSDEAPPPLGKVNPALPPWLEGIVTKLLAKGPAERFSSASELATILGDALAHLDNPGLVPAPQTPAATSSTGAPSQASTVPDRRPVRSLVLHRVFPAVLVLAILAVVAFRLRDAVHLQKMHSDAANVTASRTDVPRPRAPLPPARALDRPKVGPVDFPRAFKPVISPVPPRTVPYRALPALYGLVLNVAYSPDGNSLAIACVDTTVRIWDIPTDTLRATLRGHTSEVRAVAFSPDGKTLVSAGGDWNQFEKASDVKLWDLTTFTETASLKGHTGLIFSVAFSPDGKSVASSSADGNVRIWDVARAAPRLKLPGHKDFTWGVAFSPDGKLVVSGCADGWLRVWDASTGTLRTRIETGQAIISLAFHPDGQAVATTGSLRGQVEPPTGNFDGSAVIWSLPDGRPLHKFRTLAVECLAVAFSPDGHLLASSIRTAGNAGEVTLWNVQTALEEARLSHQEIPTTLAFSPNGRDLAVGLRGLKGNSSSAGVWSIAPPESRAAFRVEDHAAWFAVYRPDGKTLAAGGDDGVVKLLDADNGRVLARLDGPPGPVTTAAFSPDGKTLAAAAWARDPRVRLWDCDTRQERATLQSNNGHCWKVAFNPSGSEIVAATGETQLASWNAQTLSPNPAYQGKLEGAIDVAFSSDGATLAVGTLRSTIELVDTASRKSFRTLEGHTELVRSVAFSPDGSQLASGSSDHTVRLWDLKRGINTHTLRGLINHVLSVAFSPDGKMVAAVGADRVVAFWNAATGDALTMLHDHSMDILTLAFSPDRRTAATASLDGTVRLWNVPASPSR